MTDRERGKYLINRAFGGHKHLMTNKIVSYGLIDKHTAYEISKGYDHGSGLFPNGVLYGVSIVRQAASGDVKSTRMSRSFNTGSEASGYVADLKRQAKLQHNVRLPRNYGVLE